MRASINTYLSTDSVRREYVKDYWNDFICNTYVKLSSSNINEDHFFGKIHATILDNLEISRIRSTAQKVKRTKKLISQSTAGYFIVNLQISGSGIVKQDDRISLLKPNDWTFTDATRPYELEFHDDFEQLVIKIPRSIFKYALPQLNNVTARLLDGNVGNGKIASKFFKSLYYDCLSEDGSNLEKTLSSMTITLIKDCLSLELLNQQTSPSLELLSFRIKSYIMEHLDSPELSIKHLAQVFKCSTRYLHQVFENEKTTINNFIVNQRLLKCKQQIEHPTHHSLSLSQICYSQGFNSLSHFSKLFKLKYGISPSCYRNSFGNEKVFLS